MPEQRPSKREGLPSLLDSEEDMSESAAGIQIPETMVMHRADGSSLQGSFASLNGSTNNNDYKSSNSCSSGAGKTKRPAHVNSFTHDSSGESSQDQPQQQQRRPPQKQLQQQPHPSIQRVGSDEQNSSNTSTGVAGGLLSAPLQWVQKSRERRRRLNLQQQAEEQLRKIAEAEGLHPQTNGLHPNLSNAHIQHLFAEGGDDHHLFSHHHGDDEVKIGTQHLSKSGEGMTAELDFDLENDEDEFLVPKVRIHAEPRLLLQQPSQSDDSINALSSSSPTKAEFKTPAFILTPEQMHQIAIHVLPRTIAYCQWRRIYSLSRDGDSFDGCLRLISEVPRTLMVVRTTRGSVFGGYADSPWRPQEINARFYGSAQACLFSVKDSGNSTRVNVKSPSKRKTSHLLNVYRWSGKNRYIQLCDTSSKMLAFGGGGSDGAFGLCVQEDFQSGSTGPCDTFDNDPLCDQETFEIVDVEFWEFLTGVF